jgi:HK97 family phage portal protein
MHAPYRGSGRRCQPRSRAARSGRRPSTYDLLDSEPNEWQDPPEFKETLAVHCPVTNNAYAFKNVGRGEIKELIPIVPTHVQPKWTSDRAPYYVVTAPDGSQEPLRGLLWDGLCGLDAVQLLQEPLGLALATEQTHATARCRAVSIAKNLDEKELFRLVAWVKKHCSGLDNVSRVIILDNYAKFTTFDLKGVDAEHIKLGNHESRASAMALGVLPIVIGYPSEMAARAAAEMLIAMLLVHRQRCFEKAFNRQLLSRTDRKAGYQIHRR